MRKSIFIFIFPILVAALVLFTFCDKKQNEPATTSQTQSTSAQNTNTTSTASTGTTSSNTNQLLQLSLSSGTLTTTGLNSTNTATQNSSLTVGTAVPGWTMSPCLSTPLTMSGTNGITTVILTFGSIISTGSYTLVPTVPLPGQVRMTVLDPPGQPTGLLWYSKNGTVSVTVGTSNTVAAFTGIPCTQPSFLFPVVTVSGDISCQ